MDLNFTLCNRQIFFYKRRNKSVIRIDFVIFKYIKHFRLIQYIVMHTDFTFTIDVFKKLVHTLKIVYILKDY